MCFLAQLSFLQELWRFSKVTSGRVLTPENDGCRPNGSCAAAWNCCETAIHKSGGNLLRKTESRVMILSDDKLDRWIEPAPCQAAGRKERKPLKTFSTQPETRVGIFYLNRL